MTTNPSKYTLAAKSSPTPRFSGGAGNGAALDSPQFPLDFYSGPPDPAGSYWLGFTLDHNENEAARAFARRFGELPHYILESRGLLLVGPVPELQGGVQ